MHVGAPMPMGAKGVWLCSATVDAWACGFRCLWARAHARIMLEKTLNARSCMRLCVRAMCAGRDAGHWQDAGAHDDGEVWARQAAGPLHGHGHHLRRHAGQLVLLQKRMCGKAGVRVRAGGRGPTGARGGTWLLTAHIICLCL